MRQAIKPENERRRRAGEPLVTLEDLPEEPPEDLSALPGSIPADHPAYPLLPAQNPRAGFARFDVKQVMAEAEAASNPLPARGGPDPDADFEELPHDPVDHRELSAPELDGLERETEQQYLEFLNAEHRPHANSPWPQELRLAAARVVCTRIALGQSLNTILAAGDRPRYLPSAHSFLSWVFRDEDPAIRDWYDRAREIRAEKYADEAVEIADLARYAGGKDNATVQACKLRVQTRQWAAAKFHPKTYGEKVNGERGVKVVIGTNLEGAETQAQDGAYEVSVKMPGRDAKDITPEGENP